MKRLDVFRGNVMKKALAIALYALAFQFAITVSAQEASEEEVDLSVAERPNIDVLTTGEESGGYRDRKFINLTLGIEQDEKLPRLPENVVFKGDFRKIVQADYAKELGILRFTPKAEGFATMTIHNKSNGKVIAEFRIDVKKNKLDKVVREMRALLSDIEGINIKIVNNKVVVDGQILLPKDLARIYNVVQQFGDQASSLVTLSPLALKKIAEFISRDINNPEIEVRAINDKLVLSGWANDDMEKASAEIIAKTYLPDIVIEAAEEKGVIKKRKPANDGVINMIKTKEKPAAPPAKMVQVVVHFVELSKDYMKKFNFQFTPSLKSDSSAIAFSSGGAGGAGGVVSEVAGVIDNLLPKLNWAKSHGFAKVLESTSFIVENGQKGQISQMSKHPFLIAGPDGTQSTSFQDVGLESIITPSVLGDKSSSVSLTMDFKVSSVTGITAAGPIIAQNAVNTKVTIRDRQSAAVGGLIKNASFTDYNKPTNTPSNPIISLYASKAFSRSQSQFVVFVTPIIKTSASAGAEQIKKKFRLRD